MWTNVPPARPSTGVEIDPFWTTYSASLAAAGGGAGDRIGRRGAAQGGLNRPQAPLRGLHSWIPMANIVPGRVL